MKENDHVILVIGHKRPRFLGHVLESLKRQNALEQTQVWIDGHGYDPNLSEQVNASAELRFKYPQAKWIVYQGHVGFNKITLDALTTNIEKFQKFIVLEDDCFPAPDAIAEFLEELRRIDNEDEIFSVYGTHRGIPGEQNGFHQFRSWAWATTATKLKRILPECRALSWLPEPEYLDTIRRNLTDEIRSRLSQIPQLSPLQALNSRFLFDSAISYLTAREGLKHRATSRAIAYNFGLGMDCWHFSTTDPKYLKPPFNLVTEQELIKRFDLPSVDWFDVRKVEPDRLYTPISGSNDCRLLVSGWCEPEPWGTWTTGERSVIEIGCDLEDAQGIELKLNLRAFIANADARLRVRYRINSSKSVDWEFTQKSWQSEKSIFVSSREWAEKRPAELVFEVHEATSPKDLGLSEDNRKIGLGLLSIKATPVKTAVPVRA